MSEQQPPPRWLTAPPADLPESFLRDARAYRAQGPHDAQRDRMWQQLERELGAGVVKPSWRWPWLGTGALFIVAAGLLAWLWPTPTPRASAPPPMAAEAILPASVDLTLPDTRTPDPVKAAAAPAPADNSAAVKAPAPARSQHTQPVRAARAAAVEPPPMAAVTSSSVHELELLVRARRVLRSAPARALALTDEHRAQFPSSLFVEERELLAIEALQGLGQRELAAERVRRFRAAFPDSAHRHRLETAPGRE